MVLASSLLYGDPVVLVRSSSGLSEPSETVLEFTCALSTSANVANCWFSGLSESSLFVVPANWANLANVVNHL